MFNYRYEKKRFDEKWKKIRREYTKLGMTPEDIQKLFLYDLNWFRSERTYKNRTQDFPSESISDETDVSTLFQKFKSLYEDFDERNFSGHFAWVETIKDPILASKLKQLSYDDLMLLTMLTYDGYSQSDIARIRQVSRNAIYKKVKKIKDFLKRG